MDLALPHLECATGGSVDGLTDGPQRSVRGDPRTVAADHYEEIVISTLPARVLWLRRDLPRRVEALGVPVLVITAADGSERLPHQIGCIHTDTHWRDWQ